MKYACQYAIVRFMPYAETGEFANMGIVLMCPEAGYFDFKLLDRVTRIKAFFSELDATIYRNTRAVFAAEMRRLRSALMPGYLDGQATHRALEKTTSRQVFAELIKPSEAIVRFDAMRVVLANDPAEKLAELYAYYVGRSFAAKAYQEQMVEKEVKQVLRAANLIKIYRPETLGNEAYHARFQFVKMENHIAVRAIKPLHLAHDDPAALFDHGWEWVGKIRKLRREGLLPSAVLFAVNAPDAAARDRMAAYKEIVTELRDERVSVVPYLNRQEIHEFAAQS